MAAAGGPAVAVPAASAPAPSDAGLAEERRGAEALREQCRAMLAAHGTSLGTDEALLRGEGAREELGGLASARVRQAIECRLERKRLIAAAEEALALYGDSLQ